MSRARTLLPIAGPLAIAAGLAVVTALGDDAPTERKPAQPVHSEHARASEPPAPAPSPPRSPIDRPRCIASLTLRDLTRQLLTTRTVATIVETYRDEASPAVARAFVQALADAATALPPSVARSRVLVIAAEGLARLGQAPAARAALEASRALPPVAANELGFERSDWRGEAARVAERLDDPALATTLVEGDHDARAALARHYAEIGEVERARALLEPEPEHAGLGWRVDEATALAGTGELEAALALADRTEATAALVRLEIARTLAQRGLREPAVAVLSDALEHLGSDPERPGQRIGTLVAIGRALAEAGDPSAAAQRFAQARAELTALGDHFQALEPWAALIDAEHRTGHTATAWADLEGLGRVGLADVQAAPMTRVLLLSREGRLDEALALIHATAGMPYALAYAVVHARMREPSPALAQALDDGLRTLCPAS